MFKGVLTENYIACELYPKSKELYYYNFDRYEIDFLIKIDGDNGNLRNLFKYYTKFRQYSQFYGVTYA